MEQTLPEVFFNDLGMNVTQSTDFRKELMNYATNNLILVTTYIDSPYVSNFETSQVSEVLNKFMVWALMIFFVQPLKAPFFHYKGMFSKYVSHI